MQSIKFTKMHGAGNDYIFVNCFKEKVPKNLTQLAQEISSRHFGVGGDGLILIMPPEDKKKNDARMRIFNLDGSEGEICGNGIRCVAKYIFDNKISSKKQYQIETLAGIIKPKIVATSRGKATMIEVDMGLGVIRELNKDIVIDGKRITGHNISMGNPHFVIFVDDLNDIDFASLGAKIERHPFFPKKTNVEFIQLRNRKEIIMRVWERGSGITLACGTGACASVVASNALKLTDNEVTVHLLGGALQIKVEKDGHVIKTGPAEVSFTGEYEVKD